MDKPNLDDFINGSQTKKKEQIQIPSFKKSKKFPLEIPPELDELIYGVLNASTTKLTKHDFIITAIVEKLQRQ